jgi:hypothetical protein
MILDYDLRVCGGTEVPCRRVIMNEMTSVTLTKTGVQKCSKRLVDSLTGNKPGVQIVGKFRNLDPSYRVMSL